MECFQYAIKLGRWEVYLCNERVDVDGAGKLVSRSDLHSFGVAGVMEVTLLVGFSLAIVVCVVMCMVGSNLGEGLT